MSTRKEEYVDITDDVIAYVVGRYDEIGKEKGYDKVLIDFKKIHEQGIQTLKDRIFSQNPYNYLSIMERCTDDSPRTIQRICYKK